jgi:hypothetical protein
VQPRNTLNISSRECETVSVAGDDGWWHVSYLRTWRLLTHHLDGNKRMKWELYKHCFSRGHTNTGPGLNETTRSGHRTTSKRPHRYCEPATKKHISCRLCLKLGKQNEERAASPDSTGGTEIRRVPICAIQELLMSAGSVAPVIKHYSDGEQHGMVYAFRTGRQCFVVPAIKWRVLPPGSMFKTLARVCRRK